MATNNQIKFYKKSIAPSGTGLQVGAIWFNTTNRTINVYTGDASEPWQKYAGLVDAKWSSDTRTLTITNAAGENIEIKDLASASAVQVELTRIEGLANVAQSAANAAQADVDALEEAIGTGFSKDSTVAAQLAAVKSTADAAAVKATVDAELAKKADSTQVATDIKAAIDAEVIRANGAYDAKDAAAGALASANQYTDGKNSAMDDRVKILETAIGTGGEVGSQIDAKINALDATVDSTGGAKVAVNVVETDGKITSVTVAETDIASAQALDDEIQRATQAEQALTNSVDALAAAETGRVSVLETKVEALTSATHFEGVVEFDPSADNAISEGYDVGDIVIYGNKEFILDKSNKWVELGDTNAVSEALTQLGATVSSNTTAIGEVSADLNTFKTTVSNTYATQSDFNALNGTVSGHTTQIGNLETAVGLNTAARTDHAGRIQALENTANALGTTYVTVANYNDDKAAAQQKHTDLQGEIDAAEGRLDTVAAAITRLDGEQATQNQQIAAADAKGAQGITDAAAALAEAQKRVSKVSGDADVAASTTGTEVALSLNKATAVALDDHKAVTADAVFKAMCWVEF